MFALGFDAGCGFALYCCSLRLVFCGFDTLSGFPAWIGFMWCWYNMDCVVLVVMNALFVVDICVSGGGCVLCRFWYAS